MKAHVKQILLPIILALSAASNIHAMASERPELTQEEYQAFLWTACEEKNVEMARAAIAHGANVNDKRSDGMTPLLRAVGPRYERQNSFESWPVGHTSCALVSFLVEEAKANVQAHTNFGLTALHFLDRGSKESDAIEKILRDAGLRETTVSRGTGPIIDLDGTVITQSQNNAELQPIDQGIAMTIPIPTISLTVGRNPRNESDDAI